MNDVEREFYDALKAARVVIVNHHVMMATRYLGLPCPACCGEDGQHYPERQRIDDAIKRYERKVVV